MHGEEKAFWAEGAACANILWWEDMCGSPGNEEVNGHGV